jgi:Transglycosylase SLT domain
MRSNGHGRAYTQASCLGKIRRFIRTAMVLLCSLGLLAGANTSAMDRFAALSMVESGNNDSAIGPSGEISRYQVLPSTWQHYAKGQSLDPMNPTNSLSIAQAVMSERCAQFQKTNHRPPTDFEFYLLWNCPAHVAHPGKLAADTAQRFANLCQRP